MVELYRIKEQILKNRTYKSLTVFLVTLILLSTFTFLVSTSAQDKNLVEKAELSFGVIDKASASLVFGEKNCTIKPLVFGSDKVFSESRGQQNKVTLNSEKYNVLVEEIKNGVEYVLVVKDKLERGFVEFEVDTTGYSVRQDGSLLTELPKKEYVVWNETYAFDGVNETRKDISLVGALRFIPEGAITEEFVIKRPYIYDSKGLGVWGEQSLNGNVLTVTVPKDFLEKAVYPIYIDPTIIFSDGFESGDFSAWTNTREYGTCITPAVQNTTFHHGSYSAKLTKTEGNGGSEIRYVHTKNLYYIRFYAYITALPSVSGDALTLVDLGGGNRRFYISNDDGTIKYNFLAEATTYTFTETPAINTWICFEVAYKVDTTTGFAFLAVNDVVKINETDINTGVAGIDVVSLCCGSWGLGAEVATTIYYDCVVISDSYIGTEATVPELVEVALNKPSNASTITSYSQNFTYTPTIIGSDSIQNASLYIDNSLVASNATAITNATANTIPYTFTSNGEYEWTIGVFNSTHLVFPYGNYTITVSVNDSLPESVEVSLNTPTNASTITSYSQNFTYTPTLLGSDAIQNASLYINNTLVASNSTAITNNITNGIVYTFLNRGEYVWTIGIWNSTHLVFPTTNNTISIIFSDEDILSLKSFILSTTIIGIFLFIFITLPIFLLVTRRYKK